MLDQTVEGKSQLANVDNVHGHTQLTPDEVLSKLIKESPKAVVSLAGVSVECILDTGAETSLISLSFFHDHLAEKLSTVNPVKSCVQIVGANGLDIPIVGYVEIPLAIQNYSFDAHFFIVDDSSEGKIFLNRKRSPVLLGCNVLYHLKEHVDEFDGPDTEAWNVTMQWLDLTKPLNTTEKKETKPSMHVTVNGRIGRKPVVIHSRQVQTVVCQLRTPPNALKDKLVIVEGNHDMGEMCLIYDTCETSNGKTVTAVVANLGSQPLVIPPYTKLVEVTEVTNSNEVVVEQNDEHISVSVCNVLVESVGDISNEYKSMPRSDCQTQEKSPNEVFTFSDGSQYCMPPGLNLELCELSTSEKERVVRLIQKHDAVFSKGDFDVGFCTEVPHKISTTDEQPVNQPYRRIPPHYVQEVKDTLQQLLDQGIIESSNSPYASPVVLVKKKDGSLRICVDYRQLNKKTLKDAFPLPRIEESLDALNGAVYFSSLDLAHGYHQVVMDADSRRKTAFRVPFGLFEYNRMPFGLVNAPSTFQRVMEQCLGDMNLTELLIYLDDILLYSSSFDVHLETLDKVLTRLGEFGLKVKGKKCSLFQTEVTYLGHVVNAEGISVDKDKIQKVLDWPVPTNCDELRSFLGLASYYRRFVKGFSSRAAPLHAILPPTVKGKHRKQLNTFVWSQEAQSAFDDLKSALTSVPVLKYPDFSRPFVLEIDASLKGLGACLMQEDSEGVLHPVAYASRGLRGAEKNYPDYSSFKLELLALKWAVVDKFKDYLIGTPFTVLTDNNPLAHIQTAKLEACAMRWVAQLAAFNFDIKFRSGKSNKGADALSRYPEHVTAVEVEQVMCEKLHSTSIRVDMPRKVEVNQSTCDIPSDTAPPGIFPSLSPRQLTALQRSDPVLKYVWKRWDGGLNPRDVVEGCVEPPEVRRWLWQWSRIVEKDGVLCRHVNDPIHGEIFQYLLPDCLRSQILEGAHDGWGHQGVTKTFSILRRRVYWPRMASSVHSYISRCSRCVVAKSSQPRTRTPMRHLIAFRPLEVVAIDFVKVDKGYGGFEDVLIITDVYTKFTQAVPCKNQHAVTVAKALRDHWFTKFGIPSRIHSDQGRNFEGDVIKELCKLYGIRKTHTSPYHPEGNAQAERFNRTLFGLIKSLDTQMRHKWPDFLSHLIFVYNTTPHCTTGIAPYTLMFGREPLIPLDQILGHTDCDWNQDFVKQQSELLERTDQIVRERIRQSAHHNKVLRDEKAPCFGETILVGTPVLLKKCAFSGRHKIKDVFEKDQYIVVWHNEEADVYAIRPVRGGTEKVVHRRLLRVSPLVQDTDSEENVQHSQSVRVQQKEGKTPVHPHLIESDESDSDEILITTMKYAQGNEELDVSNEIVGEIPCNIPMPVIQSPPAPVLRRSTRSTRGQHRNPFRLPQSGI